MATHHHSFAKSLPVHSTDDDVGDDSMKQNMEILSFLFKNTHVNKINMTI